MTPETRRSDGSDAAGTVADRDVDAAAGAGRRGDHRGFARLVGRWWFWAGAVAILFCLPLLRSMRRRLPPRGPILADVPAETLTVAAGDDAGKPMALAPALAGKVWVATFLDPTDPPCERLGDALSRVQRRARNLGDAYRLVSFVAPGAPPATVDGFAARHHPNPSRWWFLVTDGRLEEGFSHALIAAGGVAPVGTTVAGQLHGKHLAALVDRHGHVRGFYDILTRTGEDALLADLGLEANLDP